MMLYNPALDGNKEAKGKACVLPYTLVWRSYCSSGSCFLSKDLLVRAPLSYPLLSPDSFMRFSINLSLIPSRCERPALRDS